MAKKPRRVLVEVLPRYNDPAAAWGTPGEPGDIITDGDGNQLATDLDYNRRKAALAFVDPTAAPPMEFIGARYVLNHTPGVVDPRWDGATQGDIVEFVAGELPTLNRWVAQTPIIGWSIYIRALNYDLIFDLTSTWTPRSFALPPHAPTHQHGGGDEVATVTPASNAIPKADGTGKLDPGWLPAVVVPVPSSRTITAGAGLVGGGDLTVDRTIDAAANADGSIIVNPDDIQVGVLATDGQHGVRGGGTQHALATPAVAGFMSPADKTKIDNVVTGPHTPLSNVAPLNVTKAPASAGGAVEASRQDHKHDVDTATAVELTDTTNAEGAATSLARSDHQHAHGNRGGGTLHALVTALAAGFMSAADKIKLDGLLPGGGVQKTEQICIQSNDKAYSKVTGSTYSVVARFRFRGTGVMGSPANIRANIWASLGTAYCRIYDVTNSNTICSASTASTDDTLFTDLGALSSLPVGPATFEVQLKTGGLGQAQIGSVIVEY